MADAIERIKCGQIFILSNCNFALRCDFCGREDFHTLDVFRSHIKDHFLNSEDDVCISSDSECEYVPPTAEAQLVSTLQNDAEQLLMEREWVPSGADNEFCDESSDSERNQRRRKRQRRIRTISSTNSNGNANISEANVEDGSQTTTKATKQLRTRKSINYNDDIRAEFAEPGSTPSKIRNHSKRTYHYECRFCHKVLSSITNLRAHENNHESKRPYKCEICSRAFAAKYNLIAHVKRSHTKDLPHSCSLCVKRYHYPCQLKIHIRRKHTLFSNIM